ncbi:MAG TPA: phage portal protein, partial [Phycisphaerales bacterium]|nr:phage portal protein [Phycisphaerales bacterium]
MSFQLEPFAPLGIDETLLNVLIHEHEAGTQPRLSRLWRYYRNWLSEPTIEGGSTSAPAQCVGLPARLTEIYQLLRDDRYQREVVVENDIMWRVHALIDFMFPEPVRILSRASDPETQAAIETILEAVIRANGGPILWQTAALLAAIYGHVDFLLRVETPNGLNIPGQAGGAAGRDPSLGDAWSKTMIDAAAERSAAMLAIETVEAPRAFPILNPDDFRKVDCYVIRFARSSRSTMKGASSQESPGVREPLKMQQAAVTEILSGEHWQRYENDELVAEGRNTLGRIPLVHIQNLPQPFHYSGLSDVEPLIPLQDELNTRLSDRANRVTMQSFRMWLGKGIDGFTDRPVGPGQMWVTDNPDASIESFGGDSESPSEEAHIQELRDAMDRASGVTPAAAGHIESRIGNLTSENAMRVSLIGLINKVKRKREHFGHGIVQLCQMIFEALDSAGVYHTDPSDRLVEVHWADALPIDGT